MIHARTCRGCHKQFPKNQLLRIVRRSQRKSPQNVQHSNAQHSIVIDESGTMDGRGIYICKKKSCLQKILPRNGKSPLSHFLKVAVPKDFFLELEQYLEQYYERHSQKSGLPEPVPKAGS